MIAVLLQVSPGGRRCWCWTDQYEGLWKVMSAMNFCPFEMTINCNEFSTSIQAYLHFGLYTHCMNKARLYLARELDRVRVKTQTSRTRRAGSRAPLTHVEIELRSTTWRTLTLELSTIVLNVHERETVTHPGKAGQWCPLRCTGSSTSSCRRVWSWSLCWRSPRRRRWGSTWMLRTSSLNRAKKGQ